MRNNFEHCLVYGSKNVRFKYFYTSIAYQHWVNLIRIQLLIIYTGKCFMSSLIVSNWQVSCHRSRHILEVFYKYNLDESWLQLNQNKLLDCVWKWKMNLPGLQDKTDLLENKGSACSVYYRIWESQWKSLLLNLFHPGHQKGCVCVTIDHCVVKNGNGTAEHGKAESLIWFAACVTFEIAVSAHAGAGDWVHCS